MFIDFDTDHLYWTENVERSGAGTLGLIKRVDLATKLVEQVDNQYCANVYFLFIKLAMYIL